MQDFSQSGNNSYPRKLELDDIVQSAEFGDCEDPDMLPSPIASSKDSHAFNLTHKTYDDRKTSP